MSFPDQEEIFTTGRVNQKLRTRQALVDAARELAREGRTITIAEVAKTARISLTTAYRYYRTPKDLIVELGAPPHTDVAADLPADPADRLDTIIERMCRMQFGDQALWRSILMHTQQRWFDEAELPESERISARRRVRLDVVGEALMPLQDSVDAAALQRLTRAITLLSGVEAMAAAVDACGMDAEDSRQVMQWAARTLLKETLEGNRAGPR